MDFRKELEQLINRHSRENVSNTPDFILANFLYGSIGIFDRAVNVRDEWYGRVNRSPGQDVTKIRKAEGKVVIKVTPDLIHMLETTFHAGAESQLEESKTPVDGRFERLLKMYVDEGALIQ